MLKALPVVLTVALVGCGSVAQQSPTGPLVRCDDGRIEPPARLTCEAAITSAMAGSNPPQAVVEINFRYGTLCPPNARCMAPDGSHGVVLVELVDRSCMSSVVHVTDTGTVVAEPFARFSPPDWHLDGQGAPAVGCLTNAR